MIAEVLANAGLPPELGEVEQRLAGSVTLALYAAQKGAHIVRVHDVSETVTALTIAAAVNNAVGEK